MSTGRLDPGGGPIIPGLCRWGKFTICPCPGLGTPPTGTPGPEGAPVLIIGPPGALGTPPEWYGRIPPGPPIGGPCPGTPTTWPLDGGPRPPGGPGYGL